MHVYMPVYMLVYTPSVTTALITTFSSVAMLTMLSEGHVRSRIVLLSNAAAAAWYTRL